MPNNLFFICPTDHLEHVIHQGHRGESLFLTSMGNSFKFEGETMPQLRKVLREKHIEHITFVLADDNLFLKNSRERDKLSAIRGYESFQDQMSERQKIIKNVWKSKDRQFMLISHHLNSKITELSEDLSRYSSRSLSIDGKVYKRDNNTLIDIYSELVCAQSICMN